MENIQYLILFKPRYSLPQTIMLDIQFYIFSLWTPPNYLQDKLIGLDNLIHPLVLYNKKRLQIVNRDPRYPISIKFS